MMAVNPAVGLVLLTAMFVLAGGQTREAAAGTMERLIDWLWEDPVMRHRILGE
jgi:hypothetical protein